MNAIKNVLTLKIIFLILLVDILESVGELFFKQGVLATGIDQVTLRNFFVFTIKVLQEPALWLGILSYMANFVLWMAILSRIDLSLAFPVGGAIYIIIPILSMIFLHEQISSLRWVGIFCIIAGVSLVSKSTNAGQQLS